MKINSIKNVKSEVRTVEKDLFELEKLAMVEGYHKDQAL
jgi:hypothetical protein